MSLIAWYKLDDNGNEEINNFTSRTSSLTWETGYIGKSGKFNGTNNFIEYAANPIFNTLNKTLSFSIWFKPDELRDASIFSRRTGCNNDAQFNIKMSAAGAISLGYYTATGKLIFTPGGLVKVSEWNHIIISRTWGTLNTKFYINGVQASLSGVDTTNGSNSSANPILIGAQWSGDVCATTQPVLLPELRSFFKGKIDQVRVYDHFLTEQEALGLYNEKKRLIAWYKLDGNANNNTGDSNLDGVATNVSWVEGKLGKAASFNGASSSVNFGNNFSFGTSFAISLWLNPTQQSTTWNGVFSKTGGNSTGYELRTGSSTPTTTDIQFRVMNGGDGGASTTVNNNQWSHIVCQFENQIAYIYVNGELSASNNRGIDAPAITAQSFYLGRLAYTNLFYKGLIDNVRIYNYALSDSEIKRLAGVQNRALVAHYKLDGNTEDASGNNLHGTATSMSWIDGMFNYAGDFSNSGKIETPSILISKSFTASMWINENLDSTSSNHIYWGQNGSNNNGFRMFTFSNYIYFPNYDNSGNEISCYRYTKIGINEWHHYTFVRDVDNMKLKIYRDSELWVESNIPNGTIFQDVYKTTTMGYSLGWNGQIDDMRIYNYALSDIEIAKLAQPLVLHYKFDDSIEEATQNYAVSPQNITLLAGMSSDWSLEKIDDFTIKITALKNSPGFSTYGDITNNWGGMVPTTANQSCTLSCEIVDFKGSLSRLYPASGGFGTIVGFGTKFGRVFRTITHTVNWTHDIRIRVTNPSAILAGDYLVVRFPQIELKPYPTPFTPSVRSGAIIKDSSLAQNHGTVALTTTPKWVSGNISYGAMKFDGISQFIDTNFNIIENFSNNSEFNISCWYKRTGDNSYRSGIVAGNRYYSEATKGGFGINISGNKIVFILGDELNILQLEAPNTINLNEWYFLSMSFSNGTLKTFINNEIIHNQTNTNWFSNNQNILIGQGTQGGWGNYSPCQVDDVRIYAKALSDSEILKIYNERSGQMRFNNSAESTINMTSSTGKIEIK